MRNDINQIIIISRKVRLNVLSEYKQDKYFFIEIYYANFVIINWQNWKIKLIRDVVTITTTIIITIIIIIAITINFHIDL